MTLTLVSMVAVRTPDGALAVTPFRHAPDAAKHAGQRAVGALTALGCPVEAKLAADMVERGDVASAIRLAHEKVPGLAIVLQTSPLAGES